jgi:colanic acid biosynthesis protein WcaM
MTDLVYQTTLGGNLTLRATNTASNPIITIPAVTANMVTTGDTATVTANMIVPGALSQTATYTQGGTGSVPRTIQNKLQESVSVKDFGAVGDGTTDDTTAINNAYAAVSTNGTVIFPQGNTFKVSSVINIPDGVNTFIEANVNSTVAGAYFNMAGSGEFTMENGLLTNVYLKLVSGTPKVKGFSYVGYLNTTAILIQGTTSYTNISITNFVIKNANFGILRQGSGSSINGCLISDGIMQNLKGDGVEFNVCVNDRFVTVTDLIIDYIDSTSTGNANWGIGIGFAGSTYDNTYADSNTVKDFVISNIQLSRMMQGIHVESGKRFSITNIQGFEISDAYSTTAGLDNALVVCYGCSNFSVQDIFSNSGSSGSVSQGHVKLNFGSTSGTYIAPCANFTARNISLINGGFNAELGNSNSTVVIENISTTGDAGSINIVERPGTLRLSNLRATRNAIYSGKAIALQFDLNTDGRGGFRASPSMLEMFNCIGTDTNYADSISVTGIVQNKVSLRNNNFDATVTANGVQTISRDVNRMIYGPSNGIPYGRQFVTGDLFVDQSTGTKYLFTSSGSLNRATDTFQVADAANGIISSTNLVWTNAFQHEVGQVINLTNIGVSGATLTATVANVFSSGGLYKIQLSTAITVANGTAGTISATTTATYVTV